MTGTTKPKTVKVRCHELAPTVGDLAANLRQIHESVRLASNDGIELLVLPELATSGYNLAGLDEARNAAIEAGGEELAAIAQLVPSEMVVVLGFCEIDDGVLFNSAAVLQTNEVVAVYRKTHLWNTEKLLFEPGNDSPPLVKTKFGMLGVLVCYDVEFPEMPRVLALAGADIIAAPVNWPLVHRPEGEHAPEVIQAMAAARSSRVAIACCDRSGTERGTQWTQASTIIDSEGWIAGRHDGGRSQTSPAAVDATLVLRQDGHISPLNHVATDRNPQLYSQLIEL